MAHLSKTAALAALLTLFAGAASASDTEVTCKTPQIEVNSGQDGTPPRMTIHCLGGSSASGVDYFAVEISANTIVAQMVQQTYQSLLAARKNTGAVLLSSNLSDTSGNAWGCSENNCRILDFAIGL